MSLRRKLVVTAFVSFVIVIRAAWDEIARLKSVEQEDLVQTARAERAEARAKEVFQVGQAMALKCSQLAEKYQDAKNAAIQCLANQSLLTSGE